MKYYYTLGTIATGAGKTRKEVMEDVKNKVFNPRDLGEVGLYVWLSRVKTAAPEKVEVNNEVPHEGS